MHAGEHLQQPRSPLHRYPIVHLARMTFYNLSQDTDEWTVATRTAQRYIDAWPFHLADGTYARKSGWPGQPANTPTFVWADDAFMGVLLLTKLIARNYTNSSVYLEVTSRLMRSYAAHLRDPSTGLYRCAHVAY